MKTVDIGTNRTGIATSPKDAPDVAKFALERVPDAGADGAAISRMRIDYARESGHPLGTMPPPATLKGAVKTTLKALQGEKANVFLDKLGERAGFERVGVRLYELVISKFDAYGTWEGGPTRADLEEIRGEELEHFGVVVDAIRQLGGDPTALTPSADLVSVISSGVPAALADPRTDLLECLNGVMVAELADNAGWELLIALAGELDQDELVQRFGEALQEEAQHVQRVKSWLLNGTMRAIRGELPAQATEHRPSPG